MILSVGVIIYQTINLINELNTFSRVKCLPCISCMQVYTNNELCCFHEGLTIFISDALNIYFKLN